MSLLVWKPVVQSKSTLSDELKLILRKKYGDPVSWRLNRSDIGFLQGVAFSASSEVRKEAENLIYLIEKLDQIDVAEEF